MAACDRGGQSRSHPLPSVHIYVSSLYSIFSDESRVSQAAVDFDSRLDAKGNRSLLGPSSSDELIAEETAEQREFLRNVEKKYAGKHAGSAGTLTLINAFSISILPWWKPEPDMKAIDAFWSGSPTSARGADTKMGFRIHAQLHRAVSAVPGYAMMSDASAVIHQDLSQHTNERMQSKIHPCWRMALLKYDLADQQPGISS